MACHAGGVEPPGGRKHGGWIVLLGGLGKQDRGSPHLAGILPPTVRKLARLMVFDLRGHLGRSPRESQDPFTISLRRRVIDRGDHALDSSFSVGERLHR